jgi:hypothetical protein
MKFLRIPFPGPTEGLPTSGLHSLEIPICDWVYFATPSQAGREATSTLISDCHLILRSAYNTAGLAIANTRRIKLGDRILVVYGGGRDRQPYTPMFSCVVSDPPRPVPGFEAFSFAEGADSRRLESAGYPRDPILQKFTGISVRILRDLNSLSQGVTKPVGNNTIRSWGEVFPQGR